MRGQGGQNSAMRPAVVGTVSVINGTTLTVSGRQGLGDKGFGGKMSGASAPTAVTPSVSPAAVTFTVDASNATVKKNNATSTLSVIVVGDMVAVQGTVNGTNVTATMIRDGGVGVGAMGRGQGGPEGQDKGRSATSTPIVSPIQGNGQPIIAGTLSAINGSSLTVSTKSNVTYTVDASSAKIVQGQTVATLANLAVGDSVVIQGAVSGTSVTASSVIDQKPATSAMPAKPHVGIFGGIGQFFKHLFGF